MAQHYMQLNEEEQRRMDEDERIKAEWRSTTKPEKRHLAEEAGANSEEYLDTPGHETNPIYIPDSQESTYPPTPAKDTIHDSH
jgi:hypothetical protein